MQKELVPEQDKKLYQTSSKLASDLDKDADRTDEDLHLKVAVDMLMVQ